MDDFQIVITLQITSYHHESVEMQFSFKQNQDNWQTGEMNAEWVIPVMHVALVDSGAKMWY